MLETWSKNFVLDTRYQFRAYNSSGTVYGNFLNTWDHVWPATKVDSDFAVISCSINWANPICTHSTTYAKATETASTKEELYVTVESQEPRLIP